MKLHVFPPAPNPKKVLVYLGEKGLDVPRVLVNLIEGEHKKPEYLAKNPRGTVPTLELDDGRFVCDSNAIIEYLEELHPEPPMWGATPEDRALARDVERHCDLGVLINTARLVHSTRSPLGLPPNPELAKNAAETRDARLAMLDDWLAKRPFVAGERVTVGDCTLFAALSFGGFFGIEVDPSLANVTRWFGEFAQRPSTQV